MTINVNVAPVPGEKKTDNNKSSYPTIFSSAESGARRPGYPLSVHQFSDAPGIVALAAAAVAALALILVLVLAFRLRRLRGAQRVVLGEYGQQDLVAHAGALQEAFAALHARVEEVAERLDARMAAAEDRLDGAIAYRALVRYDAYGEMSGPPVDVARPARRRPQRGRAVLHRPPRHGPHVLQAGRTPGAASTSSRPRRRRPSGWRSPASRGRSRSGTEAPSRPAHGRVRSEKRSERGRYTPLRGNRRTPRPTGVRVAR